MPNLYSRGDAERVAALRKEGDDEEFRTPWRRDFARLIHCPAFRRLQGKTQVFPGHESDFFRNRLTHSLEVAQIAKSIALRLNNVAPAFRPRRQKIEPDIVELAGLAHDLGHPPFGHNGEEALDECMQQHGGF
jgi:dGTPase